MSRLARVWVVSMGLALLTGLIPAAAQSEGDLPLCPDADALICRVDRVWTAERLEEATETLQPGHGTFFLSGRQDEGVFIFRFAAQRGDNVPTAFVEGETRMRPVEGSDLWTLTFRLEGIRAAILSLGLRDDRGSFTYPFITWFGPDAPAPPILNDPIQGTVHSRAFQSDALGSRRRVYTYLPPDHQTEKRYPVIYMTDGDMLPSYAAALDYLIQEQRVVPVILVGVASAESYPVNLRGLELVPGADDEVFGQFETMFTEEVRVWAETTLGASQEREQRAVLGVSNGGLFAVAMTLRHPDIYGVVFPFSAGAGAGFDPLKIEEETVRLPLRIYSTAGTLEPPFLETTRALIQAYDEAGAESVLVERVAGTDNAQWLTTFAEALPWAFPAEPHD